MKKLLLLVCCISTVFSSFAQFSGTGSGTSDDPYLITDADMLAEMGNFLGSTHAGTCFKLANDIDLTEWIAENNPSQGWAPIGVSSSAAFQGVFDGDNHTISGLYINRPNNNFVGLIGYASQATLKNIRLTDSNVTGNSYTGSLCGDLQTSSIQNCAITQAKVNGKSYTGGMVGEIHDSNIDNCLFDGVVSNSETYTGGLSGYSYNCNIRNCAVKGSIIGVGYTGGIIGLSGTSSSGSTSKRYYVENCYFDGSIEGSVNVGGIVGYFKRYKPSVYSSYDRDSYNTIQKCYSKGIISGTNNVGGIVGYFYSGILYSSCTYDTKTVCSTDNCGRICGYSSNDGDFGTIGSSQGCRALVSCEVIVNGETKAVEDDNKYGLSTSLKALKNPNTYVGMGWDMEETWALDNSQDFPYLRWEKDNTITNISLDKSTMLLAVNETKSLKLTLTPSSASASDVIWTTSNAEVATIDNGTITAVSEGTAIITAASKADSNIKAQCTVTVTNNEESSSTEFDNVVYISNFTAQPSEELEIPVMMKNQTEDDIVNFGFYLYLPEGFSPVLDADNYPVVNLAEERTSARKHSIYGDLEEDGSIHIYTNSRSNSTFTGTEGVVAYISVKVADDIAEGKYSMIIRNETIESISTGETYSVKRYNLSVVVGNEPKIFTLEDAAVYAESQSGTYDILNYTRTFNNTSWQALYVPFSMKYEDFGDKLEIAWLNNVHMYDDNEDDVPDRTMLEFYIMHNGAIEPNTPYLVRAKNVGTFEISLKNVTLAPAETNPFECSTFTKTFTVRGTYDGVTGTEMYENHYYAPVGGKLTFASSTNASLKPQRWYLKVANKNGSPVTEYAPAIRMCIDGVMIEEEEATSIDLIDSKSSATYYTLDGRKLSTKPSKSGLYLLNNKKALVK